MEKKSWLEPARTTLLTLNFIKPEYIVGLKVLFVGVSPKRPCYITDINNRAHCILDNYRNNNKGAIYCDKCVTIKVIEFRKGTPKDFIEYCIGKRYITIGLSEVDYRKETKTLVLDTCGYLSGGQKGRHMWILEDE